MEKGENNIIIHVYYFFEEIVKAINFYIESKKYFVDVSKIRKYLDIKSSNRSRINFIFRNLDVLSEYKIIEKFSRSTHKYVYRLPKHKILISYNGINNFIITKEGNVKDEKENSREVR